MGYAPLIATKLCIKDLSGITLLLTEISTQFKNHVSFVPLQPGRTLKRAELFRICFLTIKVHCSANTQPNLIHKHSYRFLKLLKFYLFFRKMSVFTDIFSEL